MVLALLFGSPSFNIRKTQPCASGCCHVIFLWPPCLGFYKQRHVNSQSNRMANEKQRISLWS